MAMTITAELDITRAAALFHALSDETRLEIVQRLLGGEKCVCDLTDALDAAQSRLSFHLKTLKDAGLVNDRKAGRWVYYTLDREAFGELEALVKSIKPARRALAIGDCCG
jgi:ArsR family transcriptional regulator, arsenate/arsenite/antimonite-responsive transcriptional repressor